MKKISLLLFSIMLTMPFLSLNTHAQTQDVFIRAGLSGNYYWGEDDVNAKFKDRISPSFNVTVGKWFNPFWAIQVGANFGTIKGACIGVEPGNNLYGTSNGLTPFSTGVKIEHPSGGGKEIKYFEKWNFFTIQPEIVYNVSNGMCGYNEKRVWNLLVHLGPSYGHSFANGYRSNSIFAVSGLTSTWRVARNLQIWMDGRFTIFGKDFDKVTSRDEIDFMSSLSAGISFNFGK